ncbi:hypothetical protein THAOC_31050 [Thalassiosira oceanica]|uniref:Rad21/Rec8-like protein C-terminal eukaryotic domain-containing protein n=1 Tax=Thalassiosira oceanica TaxID=159749 RepID=K0RTK4_THAOC|nr:hypothetical protein THAOC_31050 [Thalassiosira oceanica]|eukprot:EJK50022.1 hypothetical protein THAOC_31050 [Thalassiosira oceanica]
MRGARGREQRGAAAERVMEDEARRQLEEEEEDGEVERARSQQQGEEEEGGGEPREDDELDFGGGGDDFNIDEDRAAEDDLETPFDVKDEFGAVEYKNDDLADDDELSQRSDGSNFSLGAVNDLEKELYDVDGDGEESEERQALGEEAAHTHKWHKHTVRVFGILKRQMRSEDDEEGADEEGEEKPTELSYNKLSSGCSRRTAAGVFFEMLQLKTWDYVEVREFLCFIVTTFDLEGIRSTPSFAVQLDQEKDYGDITVRPDAYPGVTSSVEAWVVQMLLKIIALRHGQSAANAQGIIQGQGGAWPLTEIGRLQAQHANERLLSLSSSDGREEPYFWRAYSSDLKRAKDTAEIALKSIHLSWQEAEEEWRNERTGASVADVPVREYSEDVATRTRSFLADLIDEVKSLKRKEAPRILISSHGGCLKTMLEGAIGFPEVGKLQNCSLTEIDVLTHCEEETTIAVHNKDLDCWFRLGPLVNSVDHLPQELLQGNEQSLNTLYGALHLDGDDASAAAEGRIPTFQSFKS